MMLRYVYAWFCILVLVWGCTPSQGIIYHYNKTNEIPYIAICVSGQTGRMLPRLLKENLFEANPNVKFHLYYNLQPNSEGGQKIVYNTLEGYEPSHLADKSVEYIAYALGKLYKYPNVAVKNISFWDSLTLKDFQLLFNREKLDFIRQYAHVQSSILNMYRHHVNCALQIEREESMISQRLSRNLPNTSIISVFKYDYIISTREDIFLFNPINISRLISFAPNDKNTSVSMPNPKFIRQYSIDIPKNVSCDVQTKDCLGWSGINMRFQFWKRESGLRMLKNRFSFYNLTFELMKMFPDWLNWDELDFENPEQFEKFQYAYNNLTICFHNVRDVPATAVRKTFNSNICFHKFEILNCYPHESENFIKLHQCLNVKNSIPPVVETYDDYYSDMMT